MPKVTINGQELEVENGRTVLQACEQAGVEVPVFCYHPRLPIAGNCRMCLVEIEKSPKPVASCAMPVGDGMVIHTDTPMVEKARKGVLEFLLINHPLDCPICDQAGECDLQDITMNYGPDTSRFKENKRAVPNKDFGPLIKTEMTRCIHCTRCVRFGDEVAGISELGAVFRGENMEISTYIGTAVSSELSGNMIDICPVGALTSKPYAFKGRPWELTKTESIDVLDAVGSNIRVDTRNMQVMRILPRLNEDINEEWISDKTRFACDGLKIQRLDRPYIRNAEGRLEAATWGAALTHIAKKLKPLSGDQIGAIAGNLVEAESLFALKLLMKNLGSSNLDACQDGALPATLARPHYLFNTGIAGIEQADACLLIGTLPRWEATLINARLRKRYLKDGFSIGHIGPHVSLTYPYTHLGESPDILESILSGKNPFARVLKNATHPMLIIGQEALRRPDAQAIQETAFEIAKKYDCIRPDWVGYNVLHTAASRVAALDLQFSPQKGSLSSKEMVEAASQGKIKALYLLGADEMDFSPLRSAGTFVIYQGHHGDHGAIHADVILPGAAYTEKQGIYVNTEGRVQETLPALFPPGEARVDWEIIKSVSDAFKKPLPFKTLKELRAALYQEYPTFKTNARGFDIDWKKRSEILLKEKSSLSSGEKRKILATPFKAYIQNYYMTDSISRASSTMAACVEAFGSGDSQASLKQEKRA
jgi:NADH-quinone oxidoreductase subunit G